MAEDRTRPPKKRRVFDSMKHCGFKFDRSAEGYEDRRTKYQAKIDELRALKEEGRLDKHGEVTLGRKVKMARQMDFRLEELAKNGPDDRPCMQIKGQGTDHPDVGMCRFHCPCKGREDFHSVSIYSRKSKDHRLRELIDELETAESDMLDMMPDVLMLRAKIKLFLDDKSDFEPETVKSLTLLSEALRKSIETINNKKFQSMVSIETFNLLMFRMGDVVGKYVTDPELRDRITDEWQRIAVETSPKKRISVGNVEVGG